jgi:hypothetical protein
MPWHPLKGQDFARIVQYIGFIWDITRNLSKPKQLKCLGRVRTFVANLVIVK